MRITWNHNKCFWNNKVLKWSEGGRRPCLPHCHISSTQHSVGPAHSRSSISIYRMNEERIGRCYCESVKDRELHIIPSALSLRRRLLPPRSTTILILPRAIPTLILSPLNLSPLDLLTIRSPSFRAAKIWSLKFTPDEGTEASADLSPSPQLSRASGFSVTRVWLVPPSSPTSDCWGRDMSGHRGQQPTAALWPAEKDTWHQRAAMSLSTTS